MSWVDRLQARIRKNKEFVTDALIECEICSNDYDLKDVKGDIICADCFREALAMPDDEALEDA